MLNEFEVPYETEKETEKERIQNSAGELKKACMAQVTFANRSLRMCHVGSIAKDEQFFLWWWRPNGHSDLGENLTDEPARMIFLATARSSLVR